MENVTRDLIEKIVQQVLSEQMGVSPSLPKVVDPSGIISVKAAQVEAEPFDTGKPGDIVKLKDLFTLEESPRMGAGVMELDHTTFEWTLEYDEINIVMEGTLHINVNGRTMVGEKGDVLLVPKGSKIEFSTPNTCRFIYVVYPANWASQS